MVFQLILFKNKRPPSKNRISLGDLLLVVGLFAEGIGPLPIDHVNQM